jgi:trehalose utilization protein
MRTLILLAISALTAAAAPDPIRVLIWDERQPEQKKAYAGAFLGDTIAAWLSKQPGIVAKSVGLDSPEQGLDPATLDATDVIIWWGHQKHMEVSEARSAEVVKRVIEGKLGFVPLHSAHWARPFVTLMQERAKSDALAKLPESERATARWEFLNTSPVGKLVKHSDPLTPSLANENGVWKLTLPQCVFPDYRPDGASSQMTTLLPGHPIAANLPPKWTLQQTEMYNEPFHVPTPDAVVFEERWEKGEHFRSGCAWQIGKGRVFYFRPGHATYPVFQDENCLRVILNATRWTAPATKTPE